MTSTTTYPIDCVYSSDELDTIDQYKEDFQDAVSEQECAWLKDGGPTDDEWNAYLTKLNDTCGMEDLQKAYQSAYDRYEKSLSGAAAGASASN